MHNRWALGRLWLLAALIMAAGPPAMAARRAPQRLAVVLSGPQNIVLDVQRELTLPLSAEAQIVQTSDYRRAAASIGIHRHPRSNRAAPWVGRALGAQFVLLIDGVKQPTPSGPQYFVGVRLIHSASGAVLHDQRYFLADGGITPSVAAAMLLRIVPILRSRVGEQQPPSAGVAAPPLPSPHGDWQVPRQAGSAPALDAQSKPNQKMQPRPPAAAPQRPVTAPVQTPKRRGQSAKPAPWSLRFIAGPVAAWRKASLMPLLPAGNAIPYGAGLGLGRPMAGAQMQLSLYRGRFGVEVDSHLVAGKNSVRVGTANESGTVLEWHLHVAAAVQLLGPRSIFAPRLGMIYDRLAISSGPFVGLSYTAATVGLHAATPNFFEKLQLHATVDGIFFAGLGVEAARAGRPHLAQGVNVTLQPQLRLGALTWSWLCGLDFRAANFTGATALYSHARYQAMALSDTHVRTGLSVGGTF